MVIISIDTVSGNLVRFFSLIQSSWGSY